jgi:hypothetical protein
MTDLLREIEYLISAGATYIDAPTLGEEVLDRIDAFAARFLVYPSEHARHAHTLWCAHCWLMDSWEHTPRLLFISPEASCGKTRALTVTKHLVPQPKHVADLTPAALYHSIDETLERKGGRPTILHDELDAVFGTAEKGQIRNEQMRRLINAGHDRSETLERKIGKETKQFQLYSPMALAGKMTVDDVPDTIRSRSVVVPMQRRLPDEKIERWNRYGSPAEAEPLCWLLRYWVELVHGYALDYVGPDRPMLPKDIEDRDADVWEPLLAVAELAGGHWPERARVAAVAHVAHAGVKNVPTQGIELLADIKAVFEKLQVKAIFTVDLLAALTNMDRRWRQLDGRSLARTLQSYGMTKTHRDQRIGAKVTKGYRPEYFEDAWSRYLPPGATRATGATPQVTGATGATDGSDDDE